MGVSFPHPGPLVVSPVPRLTSSASWLFLRPNPAPVPLLIWMVLEFRLQLALRLKFNNSNLPDYATVLEADSAAVPCLPYEALGTPSSILGGQSWLLPRGARWSWGPSYALCLFGCFQTLPSSFHELCVFSDISWHFSFRFSNTSLLPPHSCSNTWGEIYRLFFSPPFSSPSRTAVSVQEKRSAYFTCFLSLLTHVWTSNFSSDEWLEFCQVNDYLLSIQLIHCSSPSPVAFDPPNSGVGESIGIVDARLPFLFLTGATATAV